MSSAWLLPEHIADVLPHEARRIEELRRLMLDAARAHGHELVMPPLLEHIESLLSGTGHALDLKTFKLVDQLSGRTLGVRADTTPQVARIDAHLLNRVGLTRLCYCGPVLHTRPSGLHGSREPLQFGAETYGHAGLEADLEIIELALDCLGRAGIGGLLLDLSDARLLRGVLSCGEVSAETRAAVESAMAAKDRTAIEELGDALPVTVRNGLLSLVELYGGADLLAQARTRLPDVPLVRAALDDLEWLARHLHALQPELSLGFDLGDMSGQSYYSGARFAVYGRGCTDALARGGRYDDVGAVFGRKRPAVGFSLDLKAVVGGVGFDGRRAAIRAPWSEDPDLRAAVRRLRRDGETVVCVLPGHEHEADEFDCDRELVAEQGRWCVRAR
ncbi:ATP phosphoribosyltransferase regulatory subunit [Leptothrix discophora]|uniref:ATP phosphoribosyltransferase regulatory subunit n=1 Tax=Leptothrix discophora TaxID=89 RepID=A0ABT9G166_LEPDI|nr:ATP phosphoribosyltransferase regulatory subunit [Leptothrix discophora]MDP4300146.1 ATP phosphoribosyltransferase regulatory subunit [Leptothrix discophora]